MLSASLRVKVNVEEFHSILVSQINFSLSIKKNLSFEITDVLNLLHGKVIRQYKV